MLKIGEFSKLSRVSIRMLRHYDEIGLLKPVYTDPESGYRYYGEDQLPAAGRIAALKDMGFSLSAIGQLLNCYDDRDQLKQHLCLKRSELLEQQHQIGYQLRLLETALMRLRKDEPMHYDVTLKTFPRRYAATVRSTIPSYDMEGILWGILMRETAPLNMIDDDPCYCSAVFHDPEHKESDVDVEVQKTVKDRYSDTEHVRFRMLDPVTAASAVCKGAYDQMGGVMASVAQWITDNGYTFDGPAFFIYHVSPHETSNPEEYVTEVCYPVRKK